MLHFLVPVDFSNNAYNAFQYARALASDLDARISLLHVVTTDLVVNQPVLKTFNPDRINALEARLEHFLADDAGNAADVELNIVPGTIVHEIIEFSRNREYDLIVMGTRENHSAIERWLGTVSSAVAKSALCPVLLVPGDLKYDNIQRIAIGSDTLIDEPGILNRVKNLGKIFGATLHFVHVVPEQHIDPEDTAFSDSLVEAMLEDGQQLPFEYVTLHHQDVAEGLFQYAEKHHIDLILLVSRHRNFIQSLLHASMTKHIVLTSKLPVLVLHERTVKEG